MVSWCAEAYDNTGPISGEALLTNQEQQSDIPGNNLEGIGDVCHGRWKKRLQGKENNNRVEIAQTWSFICSSSKFTGKWFGDFAGKLCPGHQTTMVRSSKWVNGGSQASYPDVCRAQGPTHQLFGDDLNSPCFWVGMRRTDKGAYFMSQSCGGIRFYPLVALHQYFLDTRYKHSQSSSLTKHSLPTEIRPQGKFHPLTDVFLSHLEDVTVPALSIERKLLHRVPRMKLRDDHSS